jgi:hypothetical protein
LDCATEPPCTPQAFASSHVEAVASLVNGVDCRFPLHLIDGIVTTEVLLYINRVCHARAAITVDSSPSRSTASHAFVLWTFASASNSNPCSRSMGREFDERRRGAEIRNVRVWISLTVAAYATYASSRRVSHRIVWSRRQRALSVKLVTSSVPNAPTMTPKIAGSWFRKFPIFKGPKPLSFLCLQVVVTQSRSKGGPARFRSRARAEQVAQLPCNYRNGNPRSAIVREDHSTGSVIAFRLPCAS